MANMSAFPLPPILPRGGVAGQQGTSRPHQRYRPLSAFDPDVLAVLKATGKGWQTRVNDVLREWLETRWTV